jgi:hypothetical protein
MKFLLLVVAWATLLFVPSWFVSSRYQTAIAGAAGRLAAPRGGEIEFEEVELFYPFDLGIYGALCLASSWASWRRRGRALALGLPILIVVEILSVTLALRILLAAAASPDAAGAAGDAAFRMATAIVRATGLIAAAAVWLVLLGRERLSLATRAWLG